jgi:LPPG:FO 2-phospho-L-lactate transferase
VKVTVLVGGIGGARFLLGVQRLLGLGQFTAGPDGGHELTAGPDGGHELTAVVNIGDDAWMYGVRICPDLDTCMYTLGGGIDPERGWGHRNETWHAKEELAAYGVQPDWFGLGDRDLATHLVRSQMLRAGYPLGQVTEALCHRWNPGATLLPASDDRCETHVVVTDPDTDDKKAIHFQEWWVRYRAKIATHSFAFVGSENAGAGPGVVAAITGADRIGQEVTEMAS